MKNIRKFEKNGKIVLVRVDTNGHVDKYSSHAILSQDEFDEKLVEYNGNKEEGGHNWMMECIYAGCKPYVKFAVAKKYYPSLQHANS